jgi:hypothetical protein
MRARECERVCAMHVDASERWLWSGLVCSATHIPVAREDRSTEVTAVLHLHRKSRLCLERASRLAAWRQQAQSARLVCLPTGVAEKDTHPHSLVLRLCHSQCGRHGTSIAAEPSVAPIFENFWRSTVCPRNGGPTRPVRFQDRGTIPPPLFIGYVRHTRWHTLHSTVPQCHTH